MIWALLALLGVPLWLIAAAGDPRLIKALQHRLQESVLKDRPLKSRSTDTDEKAVAPGSPLH